VNDLIKEILNEIGLNVSEVTIKYGEESNFGLPPQSDNFIIKGNIPPQNKEQMNDILIKIKSLSLGEK
jgi:hypothetical protein